MSLAGSPLSLHLLLITRNGALSIELPCYRMEAGEGFEPPSSA